MNLKFLIFASFILISLCRKIRPQKQIIIPLNQKGITVQQAIQNNLTTLSFRFKEDQTKYNEEQNIKHLDRLHYAKEVKYIPLRNYYNAQYFGMIELGSQKQQFEVLFDTGSSYTWVTKSSCSTCKTSGIKHSFDCENSKTCHFENKNITLEYGTGKAKAQLMVDDVGISILIAHNQTLLALDELTELEHFEGDGLAGLGFKTLSDGYPTLIDNLFDQGQLARKEFSFYLSKNNSKLIIGGIDEQLADQNDQWHYCDVINNNYWAVLGDYVAFVSQDGSKNRSLHSIKPVHYDEKTNILYTSLFVIDSGTSVIAIYEADHSRLIEYLLDFQINCKLSKTYDGIYECDETSIKQYPNFEISLCGKVYVIPPNRYLLCTFVKCYLLIQPFDMRVSILGDLFISQYYTHFKQENPRKVGFKKAI